MSSQNRTGTSFPAGARRTRRRILVTGAAALAGLVMLVVAMEAAAHVFASHDHGTLDITVDGQTLDLDQPAFHDRDPVFHVHAASGNLWHQHPGGMPNPAGIWRFEPFTLAEALRTLGMEATATTFTVEGVTYDAAAPGTSVVVAVNRRPVDPDRHVIRDGDDITIDVRTTW